MHGIIRLKTGVQTVEWRAKVPVLAILLIRKHARSEIILSVADHYKKVIPGKRPPLIKGLFVEAELRTDPVKNRILMPRLAIRDNKVYLANDQNRLEIRDVKIALAQGNIAVISEGLKPGDRVVVSNLTPAIFRHASYNNRRHFSFSTPFKRSLPRKYCYWGEHTVIRFFAAHPTAANLMMIAFLVVGIFSLPNLQRETFPRIEPRKVSVSIAYPGARPEDVEQAVCRRIEDAVDGVDNLNEISCDSKEGLATAEIEMVEGSNLDRFFQMSNQKSKP